MIRAGVGVGLETIPRCEPYRSVPPQAFFLVSAVFHYLGPAFAVLLFRRIDVLGVAWLRIATACAVLAVWRAPWRVVRELPPRARPTLAALGVVLAAMNACFYAAIDRLPLGTVAAIEFLGPVALAAAGAWSRRNFAALALAVAGVWLLTDVRWSSEPVGLLFAFANCALFSLYVILGHRIARDGGRNGIGRLGVATLVSLWGSRVPHPRFETFGCSLPELASASAPRWSRTSAISSRCPGSRGPPSRSCSLCFRRRRRWSAARFSARSPRRGTPLACFS